MAEPLGEVCSVTRRLLQRGLELQTSRCVNVFFPAKGQILFEQASYSVVGVSLAVFQVIYCVPSADVADYSNYKIMLYKSIKKKFG
jgi:hypothetical protein